MSTQPFLPEHVPPPEPPKKNTAKTLALWVLLVLVFLAIWQFLSPAERPPGAPAPPPLPPCESSAWPTVLTTLVPIVFLLLVLWAIFVRPLRGSSSFNAAQEPGAVALAERRFVDAIEIFRRLRLAHEKKP